MYASLRLGPRDLSWPLSIAVHVAILLGLLWATAPRTLPIPADKPIAVDIVTSAEFAAFSQPPSPPEPVPASTAKMEPEQVAEPSPAPSEKPSHETITAKQFHAAAILADPANREVRENFPRLASDEQLVQLCNMEALEQFQVAESAAMPDAVVGYAFGDVTIAGGVLEADGAAFRSAGQWYHVAFRCAGGLDPPAVTAFQYTLGDLVPESEWEEHFLNSDDDWLD